MFSEANVSWIQVRSLLDANYVFVYGCDWWLVIVYVMKALITSVLLSRHQSWCLIIRIIDTANWKWVRASPDNMTDGEAFMHAKKRWQQHFKEYKSHFLHYTTLCLWCKTPPLWLSVQLRANMSDSYLSETFNMRANLLQLDGGST